MGSCNPCDLVFDFLQLFPAPPDEDFVRRKLRFTHQIGRQIELAPRGMERNCPQKPGQRVGDPGLARQIVGRLAQDARRQPHHASRCRIGISLERSHIREALLRRVEGTRGDHPLEDIFGQIVRRQSVGQRLCHVVVARLSGAGAYHRLAPPRQADLGEHRLANGFGDARDLMMEGIEGKQKRPFGGRREQGGEIAVRIAAPDRFLASGKVGVPAQ